MISSDPQVEVFADRGLGLKPVQTSSFGVNSDSSAKKVIQLQFGYLDAIQTISIRSKEMPIVSISPSKANAQENQTKLIFAESIQQQESTWNYPLGPKPPLKTAFAWSLFLTAVSAISALLLLISSLIRLGLREKKYVLLLSPLTYLFLFYVQFPGTINPFNPMTWLSEIDQGSLKSVGDSLFMEWITGSIYYYFPSFSFLSFFWGLFYTSIISVIVYFMNELRFTKILICICAFGLFLNPYNFLSFSLLDRNVTLAWCFIGILVLLFLYGQAQQKTRTMLPRILFVIFVLALAAALLRPDSVYFITFGLIPIFMSQRKAYFAILAVCYLANAMNISFAEKTNPQWQERYFLVNILPTVGDLLYQDFKDGTSHPTAQFFAQFYNIELIERNWVLHEKIEFNQLYTYPIDKETYPSLLDLQWRYLSLAFEQPSRFFHSRFTRTNSTQLQKNYDIAMARFKAPQFSEISDRLGFEVAEANSGLRVIQPRLVESMTPIWSIYRNTCLFLLASFLLLSAGTLGWTFLLGFGTFALKGFANFLCTPTQTWQYYELVYFSFFVLLTLNYKMLIDTAATKLKMRTQ